MTNDDNKKLRPVYYILLTMMVFIMVIDYLYMNDLIRLQYLGFDFEQKNVHQFLINKYLELAAGDNYVLIRTTFRAVLSIFVWMFWLTEVNFIDDLEIWKKRKPTYIMILIVSLVLFGVAIVPGAPSLVNLSFTPFGFFGIFASIQHLTKKGDEVLEDDHPLKELPKSKKTELGISFPAKEGELYFPFPEEGFLILGANGTGKSFFCLMKIHVQWIRRALPGFIYDFKGNPPTLGKDAYRMLKLMSQLNRLDPHPEVIKIPKFHIFNPSDPLGSVCINPLETSQIKSKTDADYIGMNIYKNLDREAIKKSDFWAKNAFAITTNTIWTLAKFKPEFSTLAHFIALVLRPANELCQVLMYLNPMIRKDMLAIISAYENEASSQLAGVEATMGLPVAKLNVPELFYLTCRSEMNLDISNPEDPSMLVACSDPKKREVFQPILGAIAAIIRNNINQQDRLPCLYSVDEVKTLFIDELDDLPNTARSNRVCSVIAFQDRAQLTEMYGQDKAKIIMNAPGNKIILRIADTDTAENFSKMFGEYDKKKKGSSMNQNEGHLTTNENLVKEKVLPVQKITMQPKGHAYGLVSGIDDPGYSVQIEARTLHELLGIDKNEELPELPRYYTPDTTREDLQVKMEDVFNAIHRKVDSFVAEILSETTV